MENQEVDIGYAIQQLREAKDVTQEEVAEALDVTINFVSQVENGRRKLSSNKMEALAAFFDIPLSFIYVMADDGRKKGVGLLQNLVYKSLAIKPKERPKLHQKAVSSK